MTKLHDPMSAEELITHIRARIRDMRDCARDRGACIRGIRRAPESPAKTEALRLEREALIRERRAAKALETAAAILEVLTHPGFNGIGRNTVHTWSARVTVHESPAKASVMGYYAESTLGALLEAHKALDAEPTQEEVSK